MLLPSINSEGWTVIQRRYSSFISFLINFLKFVEFVFHLEVVGYNVSSGKSLIYCNIIPGYKAPKGENFKRGCRLFIGTV